MSLLYKNKVFSKNSYNNINLSNSIELNKDNANQFKSNIENTKNIIENEIDKISKINDMENVYNFSQNMRKIYDIYSNNPKKLEENLNKFKNDYIKNIKDDNLKLKLYKKYFLIKDLLTKNSIRNYNTNLDKQLYNSTIKTIKNNLDELSIFADELFFDNIYTYDIADYVEKMKENKSLISYLDKNNNQFFSKKDIQELENYRQNIFTNSGIKYFDRLYEDNINLFNEKYKYWENNPDVIKEMYDLTNNQYKQILNSAKNLKKVIKEEEKNKLKQENKQKNILLNKYYIELNNRKDFLNSISTKSNFRNYPIDGFKYLNRTKDIIEEAKFNGMNDKDYFKYKRELNKLYFDLSIYIKERSEYNNEFYFNTALLDGINTILENKKVNNEIKQYEIIADMIKQAEIEKIDFSTSNIENKQKIKNIANKIIEGNL